MKWVGLLLLILLTRSAADTSECPAPDGEDGQPGMPGTPGRNGRPGDKGNTGDPGKASSILGERGKQGPPGDPGLPGTHGPRGYVGPMGPKGEVGPPGPKGQKGQSGLGGGLAGRERPAFSAARTIAGNPNPGSPVIFDKNITNEGGCFHLHSGKFLTCKAGWYFFTYNVVTEGKLCIKIMKNNRKEAGFCDTAASSVSGASYQMNSGGTVLRLKKNDQVWLQTVPDHNNIFGSNEINSVFSGFLLFPDE
ncbi:complement C1q subcomponent subunit A-like [Pristis pectinata]|uniref:complement C1q subcomponent subunit A-like n=1 Tax=Pristis pectinata TaxID=685728 RepID=UPI00223D6FE1|nr:complement C1q subcomponent subunit A-like [Pristis pectinata]